MAEDNGFFQVLGSSLVQRVALGVVTVLLGLATFFAKAEYNHVYSRISDNSADITEVVNQVKSVDARIGLVRDEQIRRKGVLDKVEADIKWLWGETDKLKSDIRGTYELVLKNTKSVEDDARLTREKHMGTVSRADRIEDRLALIQSGIVQLEQRLKTVEQYIYGEQQQQQRGR